MNKLYLVVIPLVIMFTLSTLSMLGLGTTTADFSGNFTIYDKNTSLDDNGQLLVLYNNEGEPHCYWNGTAIAGNVDDGHIVNIDSHVNVAGWKNSTWGYATILYYDAAMENPVMWTDTTTNGFMSSDVSIGSSATVYDLGSAFTWIIIIGAFMALAAIAGISIFGSGESLGAQKAILVGTFALTIWGILTGMAYPLILEAGFYIFIVYGFMGFIFMIGCFAMMVGD